MIPTLPIGCTIVVRELHDSDTLSVGDIITYAHESAVITHRITQTVVGKDGVTRYQTQGDNPDNSADPWLVERETCAALSSGISPSTCWAGKRKEAEGMLKAQHSHAGGARPQNIYRSGVRFEFHGGIQLRDGAQDQVLKGIDLEVNAANAGDFGRRAV